MSASDPTSHAALLRAVLDALPLGVVLETEERREVLRNPAASMAERDQRRVERQRTELRCGDRAFGLVTLRDVTEERRVIDELFERAYVDELTGLPNRALLSSSVERQLEIAGPEDSFALAFIDIDNFKHINDFYSHAAGDALLVRMVERINRHLRDTDILARIGGDEFVLMLTPLSNSGEMRDLLRTISQRLKDPFFLDGHEVFASASIGVSLYPAHGRDYDTLRRNADCAMYRAKTTQKGCVVEFDETLNNAATARAALEQRFRLALRDRRFTCAFQPKVDLRTREVTGVEVLMRWRDEMGVIQPPGEFVALATELGLIDEITMLVLDETRDAVPDIDEAFGPDVTISINVAARQAVDLTFMNAFCDALLATGYPERFMVEITEEAFLERDCFRRSTLPRLRAIGAKVSIDDFGVGYSSLSALADITADEVKIDRSFVTDIHLRPRSQMILKAIESMANALGMSVVAEGVESYQELLWLQQSTGIRFAQGYYFSKPVLLKQIPHSTLRMNNRDPSAFGRQPVPTRTATGRG